MEMTTLRRTGAFLVALRGREGGDVLTPEHVPDTHGEGDSSAMRRLRDAVPTDWVVDVRGPIHYRYGAVDWEVEVCDPMYSYCDRGNGFSVADAADRCREALSTASRR